MKKLSRCVPLDTGSILVVVAPRSAESLPNISPQHVTDLQILALESYFAASTNWCNV